MKRINFLLFLLFVFYNGLAANKETTEIKRDTVHRMNEIGLVVTDLVDGSYQFRYERKLGTHFSAGLGTAIKGKEGLVSISGIDRERLKTGDITYSGFKLIPDVRYYLNKTQQYELDGFYFGLYMKYFHFKSNINGSYTTLGGETYVLDFDAKIHILSSGFMIGYKLALSKRFNIDFMILGPGTSNHSYKLINKKPLPDEFYDDLNEALKNFSLYDFVNGDFNFRFKDSKTSFSTISYRYGITVAYTF